MSSLRDKTLALAGVFQAATLVKQVATSGMVDLQDMETCIQSIFITDPKLTDEVYGEVFNLRRGLQALVAQLAQDTQRRDLDVTRYTIAMLHLQSKLRRQPAVLKKLADGIERARLQSEHFSLMHQNVIANLADLYAETVSQIPPKIMVNGEQSYLANSENVNRIRSLLLAGMRSAVLWGQLGGSRWQIMFQRKKFVTQAERLLHA